MAEKEQKVNFFKILKQIREQTSCLITSLDQYIWAHFVVLEFFFGKDFAIHITDNFLIEVRIGLEEAEISHLVDEINKVVKTTLFTKRNKNPLTCINEGNLNRPLPDPLSHYSLRNAVYVDSYCHPKKFIVTQQSLPNTIDFFLELVNLYNINVIVSLNELDENDQDYPKFWPNNTQETWSYNNFNVRLSNEEKYNDMLHLIQVEICDESIYSSKRTITIINMKTWKPKTLTPSNIESLIVVWRKIKKLKHQIVVTCYDGVTACGLFTALSVLLEKIDKDYICDVFNAVTTVRQSCNQFLQNPEQIKYLYHAAMEYVQEFSPYREVLKRSD
nr:PREDICTED: receptor-type tyrosine-protein phosphatase T-like isoform X3 [Tribolium castaneum]|eukprot:XP_015837691.1 PREDICTED: receptor-type tyrosine-protein phosphatase T-like isoform X3 [Tribolium castaneum]